MGVIKRIRAAVTALMSGGDYHATDPRRYTNRDRLIPRTSTANGVITGNLDGLRNWSRFLERNHPTARAGIEALVAIVIGTGIDVELEPPEDADEKTIADFDKLNRVWHRRAKKIGVNDESIYDLQRLAFREEVTAGEGLQRIVTIGSERKVLPYESEWLVDYGGRPTRYPDGSLYVAGVTVDKYNRPTDYKLQDPDEMRGGAEFHVAARSMLHNFQEKRANQSRGEPWLSPVIETMRQEEDLIVAELEAAKNTAGLSVFIKSEYHDEPEPQEDGSEPVQNIEIGSVVRGLPGEEAQTISHTRPSQQIAPFSLFLRQRIAAALRVPVRFLDRDVGRANFSSMRTDVIDTERLIAPDRERFVRQHTAKLMTALMPEMAAEAGIAPPKVFSFRSIPDGTPYVNPREDVQASRDGIASDLTTLEREVGKKGENWRQVLRQKNAEEIERGRLVVERLASIQKMINAANEANPGLNLTWQALSSLGGAVMTPGAFLQASAQMSQTIEKGQTEPVDPVPPSEPTPDKQG